MQQHQAEDLFSVTEGARRRTRGALGAIWFPLVLFGALSLVSAPVAEFLSPLALATLWLVGAPLAALATAVWYRGREIELGVAANPWPFVLTAAAIVVAASGLGFAGRGSPLGQNGPLLVVGIGYLVFARLVRSLAAAVLAAVVVAGSAALLVLQPPHAYTLGMLLFGGGSLLLGVYSLAGRHRADA